MKTKLVTLLVSFATITACMAGRPPIPVPGDPCPYSYHREQVQRDGWGFTGSVGGSYGPINGRAQIQAPQYTQRYNQCVPNEQRNMGNMPMPMPRPPQWRVGPPGPMANSTPTWIRRY